jgi:hypothetical protein
MAKTKRHQRTSPAGRLLALALALGNPGCAIWQAAATREAMYHPAPKPEDQPNQALYFELLGNGLLYSLNYEIIIDNKITARFGGMCFPGAQPTCPVAPIMIGYLLGYGPNKLELGLGALWVYNQPMRGWTVGETATVAWRYQPQEHGWMWKIGWTPLLSVGPAQNEAAPVWLGVASGYTW